MEQVEHVIEPVSDPARRVAAGGWRRAAVGIALGVAAGALVRARQPAGPHAVSTPLPPGR